MALLLGIDEAGYGPHLGPLVVAGAGLAFDGDLPDPSLWEPLRHWVRRKVNGPTSRVVICDSKDAFTAAGGDRTAGVAILEQTVLALLARDGMCPVTMDELLAALLVGPAQAAAPWHQAARTSLPLAASPDDVAGAADWLGRGFDHIGARPGGVWVNHASAARFNDLVSGGGRNKAAALFTLTAEILTTVCRERGDEFVHVTMDQHGGRRYYADLLASVFPMRPVRVLEESPKWSRYRVGLGEWGAPGAMEITVRPRCETWSLTTALASMMAKYVRELRMHQFNAFFLDRLPAVRPTAGYGPDAWRFLDEVGEICETAGISRDVLVRVR